MATGDPVLKELNAALSDRYVLERELGAGGMATVYLATDVKHRRRVAVKVLRPELAAALGPERFLKEIEVTANLNHPHILSLYDSGEAGGFLYYVMPHVEGESLRLRLDRERELPLDEALNIASALARALDYAHRQGVVHRDIKPSNVLLQDGQPFIADFGIALAVSAAASDRMTATGMSIGTPQYMSPEQAAADRPVDGRTDIYALACILFEMLAGEPPFAGTNPGALLARKLTDTAPDVSTVRDTVPGSVTDALRRALARIPADRFASAAEFANALSDPRASEPVPGIPDALPAGAAPMGSILRGWGPVAAALLLGVVATVLVLSARAEADLTPAVALTIPLEGKEVNGANWKMLAVSPSGSHYAFLAEDSTARRLYVMSSAGSPRVIEGSEWAMYPIFSPDGRSLAYFADDAIWRVDVEGGPAVRIGPSSGAVIGAAWTHEDQLIFTRGYRGGLSIVPSAGGGATELTTLDPANREQSHRQVHALPGTSRIVFRVNGQQAGIWTMDTRTGERTWVTEGLNPQYADGFLFFPP